MADVTRALLGDPAPGRTPWAAPDAPQSRIGAAPGAARSREPTGRRVEATACDFGTLSQDTSAQGAADTEQSRTPAGVRSIAAVEDLDVVPGRPATNPPTFMDVDPTELLVDESYQRNLSEASRRLIERIVAHWDWRRFKPPVVAMTARGFEVIDGQHTATAAATHPRITAIPVMVVEAPEIEARAAAFIGHNRDRLAVHPVQLHHAAVAAGETEALRIARVCERAGVTVVRTVYGGRAYQVGETVAVGAIATVLRRAADDHVIAVLRVLTEGGCAPVTASGIKAVDWLLTEPEYADRLTPADLSAAIVTLGPEAEREAKTWAAAQCQPLWKGLAVVWNRKSRKRRPA